jgi:cytochrome c-type biogenesis protein CcmE
MSKKIKIIIALFIVVVFIFIGFKTFMENKLEYVDFKEAQKTMKKVEVKGVWVKDKDSKYDGSANTFTFYMRDDNNTEMKVVLDGTKPNNFDDAEMVVAKGKCKDGTFLAEGVLTKCPSKYEGKGDQVKTSNKN